MRPLTRRTAILTLLAAPAISQRARVSEPVATAITRWRGDPYARGSYSFLAKGSESSQRADLARPVGHVGSAGPTGPLFFAGEATSTDYPATVHGALLSGFRAAAEIRAAREIRSARYRRVAIIGAGMAGLAAASDLARSGVEVSVIEARDRIGGRIDTVPLGDARIDRGASWIHGPDANPLTAMARQVGATLRPTDWSRYRYFNADGDSIAAWRVPRAVRRAETSHEYGTEPATLARAARSEGLEFGGGDVTLRDGYASLLPALAGDYTTLLNRPLRRIDWTPGGGVTLTLRGGTRSFDAALITVPLGVLKSGDITFSPDLPRAKQDAIAALGMGHLSKVFLRFDQPFWDTALHGFGYVGGDPAQFTSWANVAKTNDAPILAVFHGGRAADALERQPDADIVAAAMAVLRNIWDS